MQDATLSSVNMSRFWHFLPWSHVTFDKALKLLGWAATWLGLVWLVHFLTLFSLSYCSSCTIFTITNKSWKQLNVEANKVYLEANKYINTQKKKSFSNTLLKRHCCVIHRLCGKTSLVSQAVINIHISFLCVFYRLVVSPHCSSWMGLYEASSGD